MINFIKYYKDKFEEEIKDHFLRLVEVFGFSDYIIFHHNSGECFINNYYIRLSFPLNIIKLDIKMIEEINSIQNRIRSIYGAKANYKEEIIYDSTSYSYSKILLFHFK